MFVQAAAINASSIIDSEVDRDKIQKLIASEMNEDIQYLEGTAIPPGEISRLMNKANTIWQKYNSASTSYKDPRTPAWYEMLFHPLIKEGLRCENMEDLASLYAWIKTCRFAFGFRHNGDDPPVMMDVLKTIRASLERSIQEDSYKIVQLFEFLNGIKMQDSFDYIGKGALSKLLCHLYYHHPSVKLQDLIALCRAKINVLLSPAHGCNSNFYLACLITCKAEKLLADASTEEKEAFLNAFQEPAFRLSFNDNLLKHFEDLVRPPAGRRIVNENNVYPWISQIASDLSNDPSSNIKTI